MRNFEHNPTQGALSITVALPDKTASSRYSYNVDVCFFGDYRFVTRAASQGLQFRLEFDTYFHIFRVLQDDIAFLILNEHERVSLFDSQNLRKISN
jgi:hypothetical protein